MNFFLAWLLETCIVTALLSAVVWVLCRFAFSQRPTVQHLLWLLVLARFVMPPIIPSIWAIPETFFQEPESNAWVVQVDAAQPYSELNEQGIAERVASMRSSSESMAWLRSQMGRPEVAWGLVSCWIVGALFMAIRMACRIRSVGNLVRFSLPAPWRLRTNVARLCDRLNIRKVHVAIVDRVNAPFVWCWGRPRLIWPEHLKSGKKLRGALSVLAHELAHLRRRDHWVAWMVLAAEIVWWWNPLFRWVRTKLHESAEMSCDAIAISLLPDERRAYAEMFLELSSDSKTGMPAPVLGMSTGTPSSFERRFHMIVSQSVSCKHSKRGMAIACVLALAVFPTWSLGQSVKLDRPPVLKLVDSETGSALFEVFETPEGAFEVRASKVESSDALSAQKLRAIEAVQRSIAAKLNFDEDRIRSMKMEIERRAQKVVEDHKSIQDTRLREAELAVKLKEEAQLLQMQKAKLIEEAMALQKNGLLLDQERQAIVQQQVNGQALAAKQLEQAVEAQRVMHVQLDKQRAHLDEQKLAAEAMQAAEAQVKAAHERLSKIQQDYQGKKEAFAQGMKLEAKKAKLTEDLAGEYKEKLDARQESLDRIKKLGPLDKSLELRLRSVEKKMRDSLEAKEKELDELKKRLRELEESRSRSE